MRAFIDFIKISFKLILFIPIVAFMVYCNYKIDPSGLFFGSGFERIASQLMLEGNAIVGYERLDGRKLNETYAKNVEYAPQILVNGSSRSMTITADTLGENLTFYNAANTGADRYDFFTAYYIFSKEGKEPEKIVLSMDPWIFNANIDSFDDRSDKALYYEFLNTELGYTQYSYTPKDENAKYEALISPSYFQSAIRYYLRDTSQEIKPVIATGDLNKQETVIKCSDGSIIYDYAFMNRTKNEKDFDILSATAEGVTLIRMDDFNQLDSVFIEQLETFIEYLQEKNIEIILYLPPFHEHFYNTALAQADKYQGFFAAEEYCKELAQRYNLTLYGSYNPLNLNLTDEDFLDAYHMNPKSIYKIFNSID